MASPSSERDHQIREVLLDAVGAAAASERP
jgi:hypothetical protein